LNYRALLFIRPYCNMFKCRLLRKGGGHEAVSHHTQRNKKLFAQERLKLLLDHESFLELSPLAGLNMPYGDVPVAGCLTGIGRICGVWGVFMANDAAVKGGMIYPIGVKKHVRAQEIAMQNRLVPVYLVDSRGAFLPLEAELFPDKSHGGRVFYNEAIMCQENPSGTVSPAEQEPVVHVDISTDVCGCSDHFASSEKEAYECVRNIIPTLNDEPLPEEAIEHGSPLYSSDVLPGLAPWGYKVYSSHQVGNVTDALRLLDGSRFQEFKANYGTTLVTGFGHVEG
uniref:methylcrotonoyl-CoA carboxylase n=1 Tax=Melopsittacus undulatus TaxID=13146 RepID=A0A8V5G238_MELUD